MVSRFKVSKKPLDGCLVHIHGGTKKEREHLAMLYSIFSVDWLARWARYAITLIALCSPLGGCWVAEPAGFYGYQRVSENSFQNWGFPREDVDACDLKTLRFRAGGALGAVAAPVLLQTEVQAPACGRAGIVYDLPLAVGQVEQVNQGLRPARRRLPLTGQRADLGSL